LAQWRKLGQHEPSFGLAEEWMAKSSSDGERGKPLKLGMSFEDALKHVLSVGPMPKGETPNPAKRKTKKPVKKAARRGR
jgi:hypothetical protein